MAVGFTQSMVDINGRAGGLCVQLRDTLNDIQIFNAFLQALGSQGLTALGYSAQDVATMLNNFAVLDQFRQVFQGLEAIPSPVNVQSFVLPFVGVN